MYKKIAINFFLPFYVFCGLLLYHLPVLATYEIEYQDLSELPRIALVIGNSDYVQGPLKNAEHDAIDFRDALLNLGFTEENIMLGLNLNKKHTRHMLRKFSERLKENPSVAVFFYAGHGAQYRNEDYIIPVDAEILTEDEINDEAIRVEDILEKMEGQEQDRLNIIILDACRNNPFPRSFQRSLGGTGLAGVEAPVGSLIAYATGKGMVASDGEGRNGLFTKHLISNMQKPGLSLSEIFSRTRTGVMRESDNKQRPWEQTATTGSFYFAKSKTDDLATLPPLASIEPTKKKEIKQTSTPIIRELAQEDWIEPIVNMDFAWIPANPGCFMMGSPTHELGRDLDEEQQRVCIENGFWMGKNEVTQIQWSLIMKNNPKPSNNTSIFFNRDDFPVENISWKDVKKFINKLNTQSKKKYRLPTESEWEYAARAGTETPFYTGKCISSLHANLLSTYNHNYCGSKGGEPLKRTAAVGSFEPNAFGLYDMAGNVWEWTCSSYNRNYKDIEAKCASKEEDNQYRVLRGGSWDYSAKYLRSAARFRYDLDQKSPSVGFRLVREL